MGLPLSIRQLNTTYHSGHFLRLLVLLGCLLLLHHLFELIHRIGILIVRVKPSSLLVLQLPCYKRLAFLSSVKQVCDFRFEESLEIWVIGRSFQQMQEAINGDNILRIGIGIHELVVELVSIGHRFSRNGDHIVHKSPFFIQISEF